MSILYLFLCLLQFHTGTNDSTVGIENLGSVAKSSWSEGTAFSCSRIFMKPWNLDCTH